MPPMLREAQGHYSTLYTSPMARAARAQEVGGFMRTIETTLTIVNATQDPSLLDRFDFDTALRDIADIQAVPETWIASDETVAKKRQARAQAQARQEQIQAAPAQAAMMKAQAVQAKAGMTNATNQAQRAGQGQPAGPGQQPPQPGPPQ